MFQIGVVKDVTSHGVYGFLKGDFDGSYWDKIMGQI